MDWPAVLPAVVTIAPGAKVTTVLVSSSTVKLWPRKAEVSVSFLFAASAVMTTLPDSAVAARAVFSLSAR